MIQPGDTVTNPVTQEEMTFLETRESSRGKRTFVRIRLPPHAPGVFLHLHTTYTEHFLVLEGQLSVIAGNPKKPVRLAAGQSQFVPLYTLHRFWNESDLPVIFEVEICPARQFEETIETLFALAHAKRVKADGSPQHPFDLAVLAQMSESYLPGVPVWLQRGLFGVMAGVARLLRHQTLPAAVQR